MEYTISICVKDSYKITSIREIERRCRAIVAWESCPECLRRRGWRSLAREWMGHNLLYDLHIARERTRDVDLDDEPGWRRAIYFELSIIYRITRLWKKH